MYQNWCSEVGFGFKCVTVVVLGLLGFLGLLALLGLLMGPPWAPLSRPGLPWALPGPPWASLLSITMAPFSPPPVQFSGLWDSWGSWQSAHVRGDCCDLFPVTVAPFSLRPVLFSGASAIAPKRQTAGQGRPQSGRTMPQYGRRFASPWTLNLPCRAVGLFFDGSGSMSPDVLEQPDCWAGTDSSRRNDASKRSSSCVVWALGPSLPRGLAFLCDLRPNVRGHRRNALIVAPTSHVPHYVQSLLQRNVGRNYG